jgi:hypothetical protein
VKKAAPTAKDALDEMLGGQAMPAALPKTHDENWPDWGAKLMAQIRACSDSETVDAWTETNKEILAAMQTEMPKMYSGLLHSINKHKLTLMSDDNGN